MIFLDGRANNSYRSKTPTADLYSTRDKESVTISRPKTPLVDTRNWSVSSSDFQTSSENQKLIQGSSNISNSFYNLRPATYNLSDHEILECSPDRHGNPSWYSDQGRGRDWHSHNYRDSSLAKENEGDVFSKSFISAHTPENSHFSLASPHLRNSSVEPLKRFPFQNKLHINQDAWQHDMHHHDSNGNNQASGNSTGSNAYFDNQVGSLNDDRYAFDDTNMNYMYSQLLYKPYLPVHQITHTSNSNFINSLISPLKESPHFIDPFHSNTQNIYPSSLHSNNLRLDKSPHNKHGTSFEHEIPVPYSSNEYSNSDAKSLPKTPVKEDNKNQGLTFQEMTVTLHRLENGFGFRIVGGTEEGSQVIYFFFFNHHKIRDRLSFSAKMLLKVWFN